MLPLKNGLECLREIRKQSDVPVIILTARKEVYDKVAFLNAGADDYITKPFDTLELMARIKRGIQRASTDVGLVISKESYQAFLGGAPLPLTKTEFEILAYLHENSHRVKTRDQIIQAVLGEFYGESNVIDVNIKNIRAKLRALTADEIIHTIRGKGYVIRP
jgi:two-component system response regulator ArlR